MLNYDFRIIADILSRSLVAGTNCYFTLLANSTSAAILPLLIFEVQSS